MFHNIVYWPIPQEELWKVHILDELLQVKFGDLEFDGDNGLTSEELQELIKCIASI